MSEYTGEEILKLIEENGGPGGLDLSGKDLSGIDLSSQAIVNELARIQKDVNKQPRWAIASPETGVVCSANLQKVNLVGANFQGANLAGASLQGAWLRDANLQQTNLTGTFMQNAQLQRAQLERAILNGADLQGAHLHLAILRKACLLAANLQGAGLQEVNLQEAYLKQAQLQDANLMYSHLERADLFDVESLEGAYLYGAFLDDTRMRREQLGKAIGEELEGRYDKAKEAYLALKNNFAEIGRYRDESWAYVKERQMGKKMNHPRLARKFYAEELPENPDAWRLGWFYVRHTAKWALNRIEEWACGYGESIPKTLRPMGVALVGFAILYRLLGALVDANGNPSTSWLHCLLYSGGAFTTFGVDTLRPANDWIRALSIFESVVGIALTGLLGFVLANRIRRS